MTRAVDLGVAPGGWSQVVRQRCPKAKVVGIDLLPTEPLEGVTDAESLRERMEEADCREVFVKLSCGSSASCLAIYRRGRARAPIPPRIRRNAQRWRDRPTGAFTFRYTVRIPFDEAYHTAGQGRSVGAAQDPSYTYADPPNCCYEFLQSTSCAASSTSLLRARLRRSLPAVGAGRLLADNPAARIHAARLALDEEDEDVSLFHPQL